MSEYPVPRDTSVETVASKNNALILWRNYLTRKCQNNYFRISYLWVEAGSEGSGTPPTCIVYCAGYRNTWCGVQGTGTHGGECRVQEHMVGSAGYRNTHMVWSAGYSNTWKLN